MKDDITIPPEALEAAARALAIETETREDWWRFYEGKASAACIAMLKAWPSMRNSQHVSFNGQTEHAIILPLPQKEPTND